MECCKPLADFYCVIEDNARIGTNHISLYMALLHRSGFGSAGNPFYFYRREIIERARISRRTYNKCMRELQEFGYIKYEPSSNPAEGSKVHLKKLL